MIALNATSSRTAIATRRRRALCIFLLSFASGGCERIAPTVARLNPFVSFETRCAALPPATVAVMRQPAVELRDDTKSVAALAQLQTDALPGHRTVGLTRARWHSDASLEIRGMEEQKGGRACARPDVAVELSLVPLTVYVAREYIGDTCREAAIRAHEAQHVAVYRAFIENVAGALERELPPLFGTGVHFASSAGESQRELQARLAQFMTEFNAASARQLTARQALVDSPEEYERLSKACNGVGIDPLAHGSRDDHGPATSPVRPKA